MSSSAPPSGKTFLGLPPKVFRLGEMYLLGVIFLGVCAIVLSFALPYAWIVGFAVAGAVAALLAMLLGGTRVCYPLYFAGLVGTPLVLPGLPVSMNQGLAALLFGAFCADLIKHDIRLRWSFPLGVFLAFQLYYIPAAFALRPEGAEFPVQQIFYILLTLIPVLLYWQKGRLHFLVQAMVFLSFLVIVPPGLMEFVLGVDVTPGGIDGTTDRINGLAKDSIQYSFTALWSMALALFLFVEARNPFSKLTYGTIALSFAFVALATFNRQTIPILAGMIVAFLLLIQYRWRPVLIGVLVVAAAVVTPFVAAQVIERFATARSVLMDHSLTMRHDKFQIASEMIAAHPVTGIGHNHFRYKWRRYMPLGGRLYVMHESPVPEHHIDLGYLQIVTEYGVLGALIFLLLIMSSFIYWYRLYKRSLRFPRTWHTNYLAAVAALFVQLLMSLTLQDTFTIPRTYILFGLLFVALPIVEAERRRLEALEDESTEKAPAEGS